jgi:energy-coupling factor transporter ATP-binding protein EcfA2
VLQFLSIRDIVLIEALDLEFGSGLSVLTGETGAGKSILLDSLGLALGNRADSGLVRQSTQKAQVTASFDAPAADSRLFAVLEENDIDLEPGEALIIKRSVKADGGSRAFINDQPCSAALLREVGGRLIEIHGQHDDRGLINPGDTELCWMCSQAPMRNRLSGHLTPGRLQNKHWHRPSKIRMRRKKTANIWNTVSRNSPNLRRKRVKNRNLLWNAPL